MNNVVNKLLEVDRQARQLLDEARQYYDKTLEETTSEREKIKGRYAQKAEKHIADVSSSETSYSGEALARIDASTDEKTRLMEEAWERSHEAWVQAMYENCVKKAGI